MVAQFHEMHPGSQDFKIHKLNILHRFPADIFRQQVKHDVDGQIPSKKLLRGVNPLPFFLITKRVHVHNNTQIAAENKLPHRTHIANPNRMRHIIIDFVNVKNAHRYPNRDIKRPTETIHFISETKMVNPSSLKLNPAIKIRPKRQIHILIG